MSTIVRIPEFLNALNSIKPNGQDKQGLKNYRDLVNALCKKEVKYLRDNLALSSLRSAITQYRNAIRTRFDDAVLPVSYKDKATTKPSHVAIKYLCLSKQEKTNYCKNEIERKNRYLSGDARLIICNHDDLIDKATQLLDSESIYDLASGLLLLTGRRATEIMKTACFQVIDDNHVLFSGQLKNEKCGIKAHNARDNFVIPVLANSQKIVNALNKIRELKPLQDKTEKEVNSLVSNTLGKAVKRNLSGFLKVAIYQENGYSLRDYDFLEPKNLRSMYVHIANEKITKFPVLHSFAIDVLGHSNNQSVDNYMEFDLEVNFSRKFEC